jgi:hypothetical protein
MKSTFLAEGNDVANFSCLQLSDKQKRRLNRFIEIDYRKAAPVFSLESLGNAIGGF